MKSRLLNTNMSHDELIFDLALILSRRFPLLSPIWIKSEVAFYVNMQNYSRKAKTKLVTRIYNTNTALIDSVQLFIGRIPENRNFMRDNRYLDKFIPSVPHEIQSIICDYGIITKDEAINEIIKIMKATTRCELHGGTLTKFEVQDGPWDDLRCGEILHITYSIKDGFTLDERQSCDVLFIDTNVLIRGEQYTERVDLYSENLVYDVIKAIHRFDVVPSMFIPIIVKLIYLWRCYIF